MATGRSKLFCSVRVAVVTIGANWIALSVVSSAKPICGKLQAMIASVSVFNLKELFDMSILQIDLYERRNCTGGVGMTHQHFHELTIIKLWL